MRYSVEQIKQAVFDGTTSGAILYFDRASDTPERHWEDEQDDAFCAMYEEAGGKERQQVTNETCRGFGPGAT